MMPLILAMYLPQFHRVKENDEWWGEGFTDWTAVKNAKPLFEGHRQPIAPLNDNYYDLLNKDTMIWQANLAKRYGIDGFCIYHYWFKNGRQILEKPTENLLNWKEIDINYCFSWPVESWARTWTGIGNPWADKFDTKTNGENDDGFLLKQDFGTEKDWEKHFMYLLPFFKDERYIKIDDKPLFYFHFYKYFDILCYERMVLYWQKLAQENGLKGIYAVNMGKVYSISDAFVQNMYPLKNDEIKNDCYENLNVYSYSKIWENFLQIPQNFYKPIIWAPKINFDDTPRRSDEGTIYLGFSLELFKNFFVMLLKKAIVFNSPAIFINAWNEWGESMYLEPDNIYGYNILKNVKEAIEEVQSNFDVNDEKNKQKEIIYSNYPNIESELYRLKIFERYMTNWNDLKISNHNLGDFLYEKSYRNIIIYGFGRNGHMFYRDILNSKINCVGIIDKSYKINEQNEQIKILILNEQFPKCDVVIVTVIDKYSEIYNDIKNKVECPIISLYEVIETATFEYQKKKAK